MRVILLVLSVFLFGGEAMAFRIESSAFQTKTAIPKQYTCDGEDLSPPLAWFDPPEGTKSFALISDDPDAPGGTWVHWVAYNIPAELRKLEESLPKTEELPNGAKQGMTDFRRVGYGGPCPPTGSEHHYFFKLYALDSILEVRPQATKSDLLEAMKEHILARAELVALYKRAR